MQASKGLNIHTRRVISYVVLVIITILCLFWFYILFINSTRSHADLTKGFTILPGGAMFKNISSVLHDNINVIQGVVNSFVVAAFTAVLSTYFSTMTAFAIHAYEFKGKNLIFAFILGIMMIPTQVTALGFLNLIRKMKLIDTFIPLIVPAIAAPVVFYYMKQYMESTLPHELLEAARIDGAGEFMIFNRIAMPLMAPAIAVQAIFSFVTSWNNYFTPALVLQSDNKKTLPILIATLRSADWAKFDMGKVYMMITFAILPVIIVYLILSKNIVSGLAVGAVKG